MYKTVNWNTGAAAERFRLKNKKKMNKKDNDDLFWANDTNNHLYKPTATLKDYKEAIQILMVDYADVWEKTGTFKEVDKKLKKLGI